MATNTKIEWAHHTFNPWIGCTKVSAGCANCYAEANMDKRFRKVKWGPNGTRVRTSDSYWKQPAKWNRAAEKVGERHRVFCASLADVFEGRRELAAWRKDLLGQIYKTPHLDWLLLTKRPENVCDMLGPDGVGLYAHANGPVPCPQPNLWVGCSVENQTALRQRHEHIERSPAVIRFYSAEPLLGPLDFFYGPKDWGYLTGIHWVIIGCESNGSRVGRFADEYATAARQIIDQCRAARVAVFHKQMPINGRVSHDMDEWPDDLRVRELPTKERSNVSE